MKKYIAFYTDRSYQIIQAESMSDALVAAESASFVHITRLYDFDGDDYAAIAEDFFGRCGTRRD